MYRNSIKMKVCTQLVDELDIRYYRATSLLTSLQSMFTVLFQCTLCVNEYLSHVPPAKKATLVMKPAFVLVLKYSEYLSHCNSCHASSTNGLQYLAVPWVTNLITYILHSTFWWTLHLEPRRAIHGNCPNVAFCPPVILDVLMWPHLSLGSRRIFAFLCLDGDNRQHTFCFLLLHLKRMLLSFCCWSRKWAIHSARDMHDNPCAHVESSSAEFVCRTKLNQKPAVNIVKLLSVLILWYN